MDSPIAAHDGLWQGSLMDNDITATFNGKPTMTVVQGEDRAFSVALRDTNTGEPCDLTGCGIHFEFLGLNDFPVRRFSDALTFSPGVVDPGDDFYWGAHGLVTGDPVQFTGTPPAPVSTGQTYLVVVVDEDNFSLTAMDGTPIVITAAAGGNYALKCADVVITTPPTSGVVTLTLRSLVTAALQPGIGQTFQIEVVNSNGLRRIYLEPLELDVYPQVV